MTDFSKDPGVVPDTFGTFDALPNDSGADFSIWSGAPIYIASNWEAKCLIKWTQSDWFCPDPGVVPDVLGSATSGGT